MTRPLILVVEDEAPMRAVLRLALERRGYQAAEAVTGAEALGSVQARVPEAIILDLGLSDMDGVDVITRVREHQSVPIVVLSARGDEQQQIRALDAGANDYVTKPFREGELMARIRAALRDTAPRGGDQEIVVGDLRIDLLTRQVYCAAKEVVLTPTEFRLLHILAKNSGRVVTHQLLLTEVWGAHRSDAVQYLRVYMKQLRQKIEHDPSDPQRILTHLGVGYWLA